MKKLTIIMAAIICLIGNAKGQDKENKIITAPLFQSCGIYFETTDNSTPCIPEFKEKGTPNWTRGLPLITIPGEEISKYLKTAKWESKSIFNITPTFRGSIVNLKENTMYELKIIQGINAYTTTFMTLSSNPPVAKIINVKNLKVEGELCITEEGTKDGWIKYIADNDFILRGNNKNATITIRGGKYIILENLKVEGGRKHGISISKSSNVRVLNCDISGYGRVGIQDITKDGKYYDKNGNCINNDAGVNIDRSGNIVIERCYIHDPRGKANSWKYSHPNGPNAVFVRSTGGTVLRYNDFIGSDPHRWNDAVEGYNNCSPDGGFFRDAEVYGNMFIYSNDDGIELDGGQMNIRVFLNKFEGSLAAISTGPCLLGPSYLFRNLIVNLEDEDGSGYGGVPFKNGHRRYDRGRCYIFNNTIYARRGYGHYNQNKNEIAQYGKEIRGITRNNILYCNVDFFHKSIFKRGNNFDYDFFFSNNSKLIETTRKELEEKGWEKHGIFGSPPRFTNIKSGLFTLARKSPARESGTPIDNFMEKHENCMPDMGAFQMTENLPLPYRPIPLYLDAYQVNFKFNEEDNIPASIVNASIKGIEKYSANFEIKKNNVFDWFFVEPEKGIFKENCNIQFKVSINKQNMKKKGLYRGLFLVKLENGFSSADFGRAWTVVSVFIGQRFRV